jgi:hypothetical protein
MLFAILGCLVVLARHIFAQQPKQTTTGYLVLATLFLYHLCFRCLPGHFGTPQWVCSPMGRFKSNRTGDCFPVVPGVRGGEQRCHMCVSRELLTRLRY